MSAGAQVQIIGEPIGAVEVKVLTSQTHTYKLGNVLYEFSSGQEYLGARENERESRPRGSRKQQTKITFAACSRTLNRFKKIIMGHRDSLS